MAYDADFERSLQAPSLFETPEDRAVARVYVLLRGGCVPEPTARQRALLRTVVERRGKARAISVNTLARTLGVSPREIKADVRDLRLLFAVRIGSSRDSEGGGVYLITNKQELFDTVRPFIRQAQAEFAIAKALCNVHELAELEGQMRLEGVS